MRIKRFFVQLIILVLVFFVIFMVHRKTARGEYIVLAGLAQGTTYQITYESRKDEDLKNEIDSLLADFDRSLSTYIDNSIISRFNRNDSLVEADDRFRTVFDKAYEVYVKTDGAFDITVGPLADAFGFGAGKELRVDSALVDSLIAYVGMDKVALHENKLIKKDSRVTLNVNAIAQGYSVDVVSDYLNRKKIRNYLVDIGGEVRTKGRNPKNEIWLIGIEKPIEGNYAPGSDLHAKLRLDNRSLATSGNYRQFYEKEGIKYVHTIDPRTGYPVLSSLLSATVVAGDCMTADAYATAFMVFGLDKSIAFLKENDFLEAYLIYIDDQGDYKVYVSEGLSQYISE